MELECIKLEFLKSEFFKLEIYSIPCFWQKYSVELKFMKLEFNIKLEFGVRVLLMKVHGGT